jgi:predicted transcriptional regulator
MGIKEEEEQAKSIGNKLKKTIVKYVPSIKKEMLIKVQEDSRTPQPIKVKTIHTQNRKQY